ncbi:MAG: ParB N-terminal domain-containing protein [Salana multivorans]|uniref:ParB N-terminal domain-containing protein n=1 Tax=Salana multivorans TaxID=120377 RepID=UPI000964524C|nr:ParB N-terminal domain-containing protein [Salana multivorans]MBN8883002.1 ParB N-terminal domain-containing protein [Salana multivorans]OJX94046.1 MAG: hypothetical protein BGO96_09575 [Micrococcales bacterium 73-15]
MSAATLFQNMPPLSPDEYAALEASIREHGVQVPILVDENGVVIDGHHRKAISESLGIYCPRKAVLDKTETEKRTLALTLNLDRRHLNREQKRQIVEASVVADPQLSDREHARRTGVSHPTVAAIRSGLVAQGLVEELSTRVGSDGVAQPVERPRRYFGDDEGGLVSSLDTSVRPAPFDPTVPWDADAATERAVHSATTGEPMEYVDPETGEITSEPPVPHKTCARPESGERKSPRKPLPDQLKKKADDALDAALALQKGIAEDRFKANLDSISSLTFHRTRAAAVALTDFIAALNPSVAVETEEARDRLVADLNHISETCQRLARSLKEN